MWRALQRLARVVSGLSPIARYVIDGPSMLPTLLPGERIVVLRAPFSLRPPKKGDLIAFKHPLDPKKPLIKRVVAGPHETVTVDGQPYRLGPDEWFVLGDNPSASTDSRRFGPIRRDLIIGRAWFRY
jgi:nickel-type superoxide dismutase maturation protease